MLQVLTVLLAATEKGSERFQVVDGLQPGNEVLHSGAEAVEGCGHAHEHGIAARRVAVLTNGADPLFAKLALDQAELAGGIAGIKIQPITIRGPDEELDAAFAAMARDQADAVVIQGSLSTKRLADLALEHRLPAASSTRAFVDAGGLLSYGADGPALFRLGAKFVHRILQGRQPTDLPIEQPTQFELAINLKTAKAMGLMIPETFLLRANALLE